LIASPVTLFFDRNVGRILPIGLRNLSPTRWDIKFHDEEGFDQFTQDDELLEVVGRENWVIATHDEKWRREPAHQKLIEQYQCRCLLINGARSRIWQKAKSFMCSSSDLI